MTESLKNVIADLKKKLNAEEQDQAWYQNKMNEREKLILDLKETINQLENPGGIATITIRDDFQPVGQAKRLTWWQRLMRKWK